jgi:glycosyltransferase involved in cell wall biosynthesis
MPLVSDQIALLDRSEPASPAATPAALRVRYFAKGTAADPGSRYRVHQFVPRLRPLGVEVEVAPLFGDRYVHLAADPRPLRRAARRAAAAAVGCGRRLLQLARAGDVDLAVVERQLFPYLPYWAEAPLLPRRAPLALEFDDAIHLTPLHAAKVPRLLSACRLAIVGNPELARYAERHAPRVALVPTVVDLDRYRPRADHRDRGRFVVGWIGLPYNFRTLKLAAPALARLAREVPLELRVISSAAPALPGIDVRVVPWGPEGEAAALADLDVGIMPLPDDAWHRGKCGLKLLQYMAAGVPAVASPVGVNREIVADGENGLLAAGDEEWHRALRALARSAPLRARLGAAGRRTVEARYALALWAPRVAALYREAAGRV